MSGVALTVTLSALGAPTAIAQIWQTAGGIERPGCRLAVNPAFPSAPIGVGSPPTSGYGAAPDDPGRPLRYRSRVTAEVISSLHLRFNKIRFVCLSLRLRVFKSPLPAQTDRARRIFWDRKPQRGMVPHACPKRWQISPPSVAAPRFCTRTARFRRRREAGNGAANLLWHQISALRSYISNDVLLLGWRIHCRNMAEVYSPHCSTGDAI
jgi:hypothetical protein